MLDLGAVSQATITYFIEHNFKVYTEDLLAAWGAFLEYEAGRPFASGRRRATRFFARQPGPAAF